MFCSNSAAPTSGMSASSGIRSVGRRIGALKSPGLSLITEPKKNEVSPIASTLSTTPTMICWTWYPTANMASSAPMSVATIGAASRPTQPLPRAGPGREHVGHDAADDLLDVVPDGEHGQQRPHEHRHDRGGQQSDPDAAGDRADQGGAEGAEQQLALDRDVDDARALGEHPGQGAEG